MSRKHLAVMALALTVVVAPACRPRRVPPPTPPAPVKQDPPPPPPAPARVKVSFAVEPTSIERGQCATLRWSAENATQVSIAPGGTVAASGTQRVCPADTTTYRLEATGAGGTERASATLNVTAPPPPPPPPAPKVTQSFADMVSSLLQDALFDYDKSEIREDARNVLTRNSEALKQIFQAHSNGVINVEGHCDERGSAEYNLGLGDRRATAAKEFLTQLGVTGDKLKTVSYGKERPACTEGSEGCYQRNRRAHFSAGM